MGAEFVTTQNQKLHADNLLALLLGALGAGLVALGVAAPWALGVLGGVLVLTLSFVANETFLLSLIFLMPLDFTLEGDAPVRDIAVAVRMLVLIGYFLGQYSRGQFNIRRLWRPAVTKAAFLFLFCLAISTLFGTPGEIHTELRGLFFIGSYIAFYLVMLDWLVTVERRQKLLSALLWSTLIVALFGLVQLLWGNYTALWHFLYRGQEVAIGGAEELGRIPSFLGHPNHLASYLNLVLPLGLACGLLGKDRRWRRLGWSAVILGTIALSLTQSRGGYLAFVMIIIYSIWHFAKTRRQKILLALVFAFVTVSVYALLQLWNPRHFADYTSDMSVLSRLYLWAMSWHFFLSSPLHGVGIGTFASLFEPYFRADIPGLDPTVPLEAHNIYFELLAETGILGFVSFFAVVLTAYREARRQLQSPDWFQRAFAFGISAGIVGMLVGEFFDHSLLWAPQVGFLFWVGIAGLIASTPKVHHARKGTFVH